MDAFEGQMYQGRQEVRNNAPLKLTFKMSLSVPFATSNKTVNRFTHSKSNNLCTDQMKGKQCLYKLVGVSAFCPQSHT